jgi:hypothetical protein
MKNRFHIKEVNPYRFKLTETNPFCFFLTELNPFKFWLTEIDADTQKPVLITAILINANTIELTYSEDLNESIIPDLVDYIFNGGSSGVGTWKIGTTFIIS